MVGGWLCVCVEGLCVCVCRGGGGGWGVGVGGLGVGGGGGGGGGGGVGVWMKSSLFIKSLSAYDASQWQGINSHKHNAVFGKTVCKTYC